EKPLLALLQRYGLDGPTTVIESMETENLRELSGQTSATLVQLLMASGQPYDLAAAGDPRSYTDLTASAELRAIAGYAGGIGAQKKLVLPRGRRGRFGQATSLVRDAHAAGLLVLVWTLRDENKF